MTVFRGQPEADRVREQEGEQEATAPYTSFISRTKMANRSEGHPHPIKLQLAESLRTKIKFQESAMRIQFHAQTEAPNRDPSIRFLVRFHHHVEYKMVSIRLITVEPDVSVVVFGFTDQLLQHSHYRGFNSHTSLPLNLRRSPLMIDVSL